VSDEDKSAEADREAHRAQIMSWVWWAQIPVVTVLYWLLSKEPIAEKIILIYLANVSIIALAVTYTAKREAAESKKAGYE